MRLAWIVTLASVFGDALARVKADDDANAAAFSADGARLATAAEDYTLKVWYISSLLGRAQGGP